MISVTLNDRQVLEVPYMQDLKLALSRDLNVSEEFREKHNAWASKFGWEGGSMRVIYDETNLTIYVPEGGVTRLQAEIEKYSELKVAGVRFARPRDHQQRGPFL